MGSGKYSGKLICQHDYECKLEVDIQEFELSEDSWIAIQIPNMMLESQTISFRACKCISIMHVDQLLAIGIQK